MYEYHDFILFEWIISLVTETTVALVNLGSTQTLERPARSTFNYNKPKSRDLNKNLRYNDRLAQRTTKHDLFFFFFFF